MITTHVINHLFGCFLLSLDPVLHRVSVATMAQDRGQLCFVWKWQLNEQFKLLAQTFFIIQ